MDWSSKKMAFACLLYIGNGFLHAVLTDTMRIVTVVCSTDVVDVVLHFG